MKKRLLAILLTIAVVLANIPLLSFGVGSVETNEQQVEYEGGWNNENPLPANKGENTSPYETTGKLYKDRIAVSKTVEETDVENYFDITLKIVAKQRVIDQSVDVVLVLDNSNTMNYTHQNIAPGGAGYNANDARIIQGKEAVSMFIDSFATEQNISKDRRLGVVTFNSYANTVVPLTTLTTTEQATSIKSSLNSITAPNGNRERFTNIEGGLQLAHNLLKESDAVYKYIIFVTDGFPTTYIESGRDSTTQIVGWDTFETDAYTTANLSKDGFFADAVTGKRCTAGTSYSDRAADKADDVAAEIKNDGINIFSIGIDVGVQTITDYVNNFANSTLSVVDRRSTNYVIGNTKESYQKWLSDSIAGGILIDNEDASDLVQRYADGNSQEQLTNAFSNILRDIQLIPAETMQEAYTIDPMSDYVEFVNFYNDYVDGSSVDAIINTRTGLDVATFDDETDVIKWWLTNTQSFTIDPETGNYELYIRYRVRLKNEAEGFIPSTAFPTNDETTFYFKTVDITSGEPLYGDNAIDYRVPEVEGYFGELVFTKVDSVTGAPLEGAEFTLSHDVDSCDICHAGGADHDQRPVIEARTAVSGVGGKVVFSNLPSGHEYTLHETKAPEGYQPGTRHTVMVEYGKTTLHGIEASAENPGEVKNSVIEPATLVLKAKKNMTGRDFKNGEFTFALDGTRMNGLPFHERYHIDANGEVEFEKITFDREGTFNYVISELKGKDKSVIYDENVYNVQCVVSLNEAGTAYVVTTTVDGEDVENDSAPDAVVFTNSLRESGVAQFKATKYMDGEAPADGAFTFELKDSNGNILQTKENVGTAINFDSIEYDAVGVYTYTISEIHVDNPDVFCDHTVYTAKVTVTAPEDNGAYVTAVEYSVDGDVKEEAVFNNKTRTPAKLEIKAGKTLDGNVPEDGQFTFELRDENGNVLDTAKNDSNGTIAFKELTFDEIGLKYFSINEVKGDKEEIKYDKLVYRVYVVTEFFHNNDSYLIDVTVAKPTGDTFESIYRMFNAEEFELEVGAGIQFVNTTRKSAEVTLKAEKSLDGKTPNAGDTFKFELKNEAGEVLQTVNNNGAEVIFDTMTYNKSGVYNYTISEVVEENDNIIFDETVYGVTVTVAQPADEDDEFSAVVELTKNGEAYDAVPVFENKTRKPAELTLAGTKTFNGGLPENGQFVFELYHKDGTLIDSVDNNADGDFSFPVLTYDTVGTYEYYVTEVAGNDKGIIYDKTKYDIQVVVTAPEDSENYVIDVTVGDAKLTGNQVEFTELNYANKSRNGVDVQLNAVKTLDGEAPAEGQLFTFVLKDNEGATLQTKNNNGGDITFDALTFTTEGTYTYTVEEVKGENTGIIYDKSVYTVTVQVTAPENSDEKYETTVEIAKNGEAKEAILFENKTRKTAEVVITALKTLDGDTPGKQDNFVFELWEKDGDVVEQASNNGSEITFPTLYFNEVGTYTYDLREIRENEFIIYDDAVYDVTITVTAPDDTESYVATVTYEKNGEAYNEIPLFANKRKPDEEEPPEATEKHTIPEKEEPKETKTATTDVPKTGDNTNLMLWMVLLFVSGGIFTKFVLPKRKKNN